MSTTILVPLDTSLLAQQALATAGAIAKAMRGNLRLILVHETQSFNGLKDAPWNGAREAMEDAYLEEKAHELEVEIGRHVAVDHPKGPPAETIIRHANAYRADLVVMTTHGRTGLKRTWLGSVADEVMRHLDIPVLMLRANGKPPAADAEFHKILIPLDGTPRAEAIIDDAFMLGGQSASYVLANVVTPVPLVTTAYGGPYSVATLPTDAQATDALVAQSNRYLTEVAERLLAKGVANVDTVVSVSDHPATAVLDLTRAHGIDLVAIASHGRGASRFLFGSVTDKLLKEGTQPLLVRRVPA